MFFETGFTGVVQSHTNISEAELLQYWDWKALSTHQYISMRINPYICIPIHANIIYIDIDIGQCTGKPTSLSVERVSMLSACSKCVNGWWILIVDEARSWTRLIHRCTMV